MFLEMKSIPIVGLHNGYSYILCWVKFVPNVPGNDRALAYILIADQYNLEFLDGVSITREAYLITHIFEMQI
jgi:hypothetical protein